MMQEYKALMAAITILVKLENEAWTETGDTPHWLLLRLAAGYVRREADKVLRGR